MPQPVTFDPLYDYFPSFAGEIADAEFTDKVTTPCGVAVIPFGAVVGFTSTTGVSVLPVGTITPGTPDVAALTGGVQLQGIAIHEQQLGSRRGGIDGYAQGEAISVMTRGRIWARASGTCTKDAVAAFSVVTGLFASANVFNFPNARFLTSDLLIPAVQSGVDTSHRIVLVELHAPNV